MADDKDSDTNRRGARLSKEEAATTRKAQDAWLRRASQDARLTPAAFRVAYALIGYVDWKTLGGAFPEQATIAANVHLAERTVRDSLKSLEAAGYISSQRRYNKSNIYSIITNAEPEKFAGLPCGPDNGRTGGGHRQNLPVKPAKFAGQGGKKQPTNENQYLDCLNEGAGEAGACAPAPPSQGAVVERLGVATDGQESPSQPDSLPSSAGSLSRLTARSPAEEETFHGSEAARYESLDPGPAYEGDVPEIGESEPAQRGKMRQPGEAAKADAGEWRPQR
jgi:DNA-binding MarR family transcriptional regulator